ncbi:MAG TPA: PAS domain-containing protein [Candidatus Acidoferrum sp.]|nr:PAS domain-containing protein [Candidatus Acidoferrum sp.]
MLVSTPGMTLGALWAELDAAMKAWQMLHRLRLAHRLLLIYLLSFVSVVFLAYGLVREKNIAIERAEKEQRGSAYVAVVRDALLAVIQDRLAAAASPLESGAASQAALQDQAAAVEAAERQYGGSLNTDAPAAGLALLLRQLSAHDSRDLPAHRALDMQTVAAAKQLISRIGEQSNLILDPDLDSYYTMSIVMLRLPELVAASVDLADAAAAVPLAPDEGARVKFLLADGAFRALVDATMADAAAAYRGNAGGGLRRALEPSFDQARQAMLDFSGTLRDIVTERTSDANALALRAMLLRVVATTGAAWRQAEAELDALLQQRIDNLYRRMLLELGAAVLMWLAALALILVIARQITRPIRALATVAERVRHGNDDHLRAEGPPGGEIGSLIGGFNAMLDRLQGEGIRERERAEATLARRNAVLDAITYAATRIVGTADWKLAIPELLARLGAATDASRAFIFEIHPAPDGAGLAQSCRFSWVAAGVTPIAGDPRYQNDPLDAGGDSQFAEWFRRRRAGEVIQVTIGQTHGTARMLFEETGTRSMLSVPLLVNGAYWGSLGFDDCRRERVWDEVEIDLLKTAAVLISAAIERANADAQLRERDSQLVEAQRIAHVGSWELDFKTDQVTWSEEGWRIFGLDPGRGSWPHDENLERIHPDDRQRVAEADRMARECNTAIDMEYRLLRPDGEVRIVHERAESVCDEAGRPVRLLGTVHDVTELKAAEVRLRASEERYALAARGADVGLWDWDVAADRAYFSPRLHEILGVGDRALGESISGLFDRILPEDLEALLERFKSSFARQKRRFELEVRMRGPADAPRWLIIRGLIVYADGRPIRLVGSLGDITDRKVAQEEVVRQREALYQSEKMAMFGSLLAGVAHELNNPLSVAIGQLVLLQQTAGDPAVVARAERILTATERCARIVRTFLAMARQRHADPKPVSMNRIVEMAAELLAHQLRSANIRVELDLAGDLPAVDADADQIHQVLTNLIVNARQALSGAGRPGRIRIATRFDHRQVELSVRDNGPGVPEDIRKRVFEPFFTTKPVGEGTGIGLSFCASIVHAHGGRIAVSDNPGGGAVFTVVLPRGVADLGDPDEAARGAAPAGLRVLIVDDEAEIANTLNEILRSNGHEADVALDGRQGLELALSAPYDLILSDMRMPVLDGPGLYRALQRDRPDMVERLAFITGDTLSMEVQSFLNQTNVPYLEKPFLPDDVLRLLGQALARRGPAPAAAGRAQRVS